jgi:hypothetical protein
MKCGTGTTFGSAGFGLRHARGPFVISGLTTNGEVFFSTGPINKRVPREAREPPSWRGPATIAFGSRARCYPCAFLWVYYSFCTLTDGVIQRNRVVATDALGAEYLAPTLTYVKA